MKIDIPDSMLDELIDNDGVGWLEKRLLYYILYQYTGDRKYYDYICPKQ